MDDIFISTRIGSLGDLCISTISRATFEAHEIDGLGDDEGYFIFERSPDGAIREVLAKCASLEAAYRLVELYRSVLR